MLSAVDVLLVRVGRSSCLNEAQKKINCPPKPRMARDTLGGRPASTDTIYIYSKSWQQICVRQKEHLEVSRSAEESQVWPWATRVRNSDDHEGECGGDWQGDKIKCRSQLRME